jgi:hypothetical protein
MTYHTGKDVQMIVTTEDTTYGLDEGVAATTGLDIYNCGTAVSASAIMTNVTGITDSFGRIRKPVMVFGQNTPLRVPVKYTWNVDMTRLKTGDEWKNAWELACAGITGSGATKAAFTGLDDPQTNSGFRVQIKDITDTTAGAKLWNVGYGGVITNYVTAKQAEDAVYETVTFTGNQWQPAATASFGSRTTVQESGLPPS